VGELGPTATGMHCPRTHVGAGCLGNPRTGKLRPAELCPKLVGLQLSPACSYCSLGYSGACPSPQAMGTTVSASRVHVPAQLATAGANWRATNCLGIEKCPELCKGKADLPPFGTASLLAGAWPEGCELGAQPKQSHQLHGPAGCLGRALGGRGMRSARACAVPLRSGHGRDPAPWLVPAVGTGLGFVL